MKLLAFMLLSSNEQADVLYVSGTYIGKRKTGRCISVLYQLEHFYVEVTFKKYRSAISAVRCFETTDQLDPYIEPINISELINC